MKSTMEGEGTIAVKTFHRNIVEFEKELGSGSFGKVYRATLKDSKTQVAIKVFFQEFVGVLPNVDLKMRDNAFDELAKVAVLDHKNVVRLLGMVEDEIPWLVFEYMKDGNLLEYVMKKQDIKERTILRFCRDICNGMAFLHRNNFLHKDLAARNILLDGKTAKIADMGLCSFLTEEHNGAYALGGKLFPYRHAAAECVVECIFTYESDIWSFGVLLFEIWTGGSVPYGKENKQPEVRRFIADGLNPLNFEEVNCSNQTRETMNIIFQSKREDRPSFVELFKYFDGLLNGKVIPIPRRRDTSPFRIFNHSRVNELSLSSERLSFSPKSSTSNLLGIPQKSLNTPLSSSNPDLHKATLSRSSSSVTTNRSRPQSIRQKQMVNNLLCVSPPTGSYGERRYSEGPGIIPTEDAMQNSLTVNRSNSPRRAASFNNISNPEHFQNPAQVDQRLLKGLVPNRFGVNKRL